LPQFPSFYSVSSPEIPQMGCHSQRLTLWS
jgi:hypothetical protein